MSVWYWMPRSSHPSKMGRREEPRTNRKCPGQLHFENDQGMCFAHDGEEALGLVYVPDGRGDAARLVAGVGDSDQLVGEGAVGG